MSFVSYVPYSHRTNRTYRTYLILMNPVVTLTFSDESGNTREVLVQSKRFTIGRTPENDLVIANANLSRRHAVIEAFEGLVQITDCGSQNGTEVNGSSAVGGVVLHDGDVITLAGVCDVSVGIANRSAATASGNHRAVMSRQIPIVPSQQPQQKSHSLPTGNSAMHAGGQQAPTKAAITKIRPAFWSQSLLVPLIAATAVGLVLVVGVVLLLLILRTGSQPSGRRTEAVRNLDEGFRNQSSEEKKAESNPEINKAVLNLDQVEKAAATVMQRISSDDKIYSFSDKALADIGRKVSGYQSLTGLATYLESLQRNSAALGALARQEGLEPGLLIYTVLAQTDGGRTGGEPLSVARSIISDLLAVRATFGTTDADSSLILLAAYKMGARGNRSHPLLVTIRRLVKHPLTQRNVWYLHEQGGLEAQVYDFVVRFLALAVIAHSPNQFGVTADPLVF